MNKKIVSVLSLITLISLSGCGNNTSTSSSNSGVSPSTSNSTSINNQSSSNKNTSSNIVDDENVYSVKVVYEDGTSAPEGINVQWCAAGTCHDSSTNAEGIATKNLEPGDYDVKLNGLPSGYAYQLGLVSTYENRSMVITIYKIQTSSIGSGSSYDPYIIREGVYSATIEEEDAIVYYGFVPTRPGKYVIESWGTITDLITADPNVGYYGNNPQYVENAIDYADEGGYDKNFSLEFNIAIEEFINTGTFDDNGNMIYEKDENGNLISGGIYTFGISCKGVKKPKTFPFVIKWIDEYETPKIPVEIMNVNETLSNYPECPEGYVWKDSLLSGLEQAFYNEEDGFYHVGSKDGYVITAKISEPCLYMDRAFSKYNETTKENEGIVGLTGIVLDNGTKDYTKFVQEYEKFCNSDGVYGVTEELKSFLNYYYLNSKDWIVSNSETVVDDESGWMFACGYYAAIEDSYSTPWSGDGSIDYPYSINTNNSYYAKVPANSSLFYSFYLKNTMNEITVFVKATDSNAKIIYDEVEYSSDNGAYFELNIGGTMNPSGLLFELTTVNGEAQGIVFELGIKEKTVAGDKITLGENTVEVMDISFVDCSFTANNAGTYRLTCEEDNAWIDYNGNDYKGSDGKIEIIVELKKGEVLSFTVYTLDFKHDYITFTLECNNNAKEGINMVSVARNQVLEYYFISNEAGTYEIKCATDNTQLGYKEGNVESWYFGDASSDADKAFKVTLEANQQITILVTTCNAKADTVAFTISKI